MDGTILEHIRRLGHGEELIFRRDDENRWLLIRKRICGGTKLIDNIISDRELAQAWDKEQLVVWNLEAMDAKLKSLGESS